MRTFSGVLLLLLLAGSAVAQDERDPWEGFNRAVFAFNDGVDRYALRPVARAWRAVLPAPVDDAVSHFFRNLGEVVNATNFALQGEGRQAGDSAARLLVNTTLGVGGLFDVASAGGIPHRSSSFGTTLGKWGVGSGNYLVLPFLGPSTVRDTAGLPVDSVLSPRTRPWTLIDTDRTRYTLLAVEIVDTRADLLRYEDVIIGDRYVFLRDIYLQRRAFDVNGATGPAEDPFLDDDFDDTDADAPTQVP